jgi:hypothetical protein
MSLAPLGKFETDGLSRVFSLRSHFPFRPNDLPILREAGLKSQTRICQIINIEFVISILIRGTSKHWKFTRDLSRISG